MAIKNVQSGQAGLTGVKPSLAYIETTDTEAQILVTGYLNQVVESGLASFSLPCMACVSTVKSPGMLPDVGWYEVAYTTTAGIPYEGIWSLVLPASDGGVILPTTPGDFAIFADASGTLEDLHYLPSNPALTRVVMESGASVIGDIPQYNDVTGTIKDSGITAASVAALLAGGGGGGGGGSSVRSATIAGTFPTATTVITDSAITVDSVVIAAFVSSANVVSIQTVLPAAGQFTINTDTAPSTGVLEYISFIPSPALVTAGVVAGKTSFSSAPATFVMSAPGITPGMVVVANFSVQGTPSRIYTALPGTDQITFVVSSGPGISEMEWVGMLPGDIAPLGLHAADYSYAGGAASVAISDASITASSIVVANFKSEAGANYIQKVTTSAGLLTILVNADPGVSVIAYVASAAAGGSGGGTSTTPQTTTVSTALAAPGTIRSIVGSITDVATTITSGNLVGVKGLASIVGISGGYVYGSQGKIIASGTISNSGGGFEAGVLGQFDMSAATLGATSYMAPVWSDFGATATSGTYPQAFLYSGTNSTAAILGAQLNLYGGATALMALNDNNGLVGATYFKAAGSSAGSWGNTPVVSKVLEITVNGVPYYLPIIAQNT